MTIQDGPDNAAKSLDGYAYAQVPEWILDAEITSHAVRLFAVLDRYVGRNEKAWPARSTLAIRMRCSPATIDRALRELQAIEAVDVRHQYRADGSMMSSSYILWPRNKVSLDPPPPRHGRVHPLSPVTRGIVTGDKARSNPSEVTPVKETSLSDAKGARPGQDVIDLCDLLRDSIEANGSKRPEVTTRWLVEMDRLIRIDGRSATQVRNMILWCQHDPFWRSNILSPLKLRAKYDQMRLRALSEVGVTGAQAYGVDDKAESARRAAKELEDQRAREHAASKPMPDSVKATVKRMRGNL